MKTAVILSFILMFSVQFCNGSIGAPGTEEFDSLQLNTPTGNLFGTLLVPNPGQNQVLILIIAGSGPTDRDGNNPMMKNNSLKMLAEGLQAEGIATCRYDKRGIGGSREAMVSESDLRFDTYVDDACAWVDYLREEYSFKHILIAGHSEGSLIGMIAARKSETDGFISLAGVGETADKVLKRQLQTQPSFVYDYAAPRIDSLRQGLLLNSVDPMFNSLFRPSVQPYLVSWFAYDPQAEISKLDIPVLIIQGTTDIQVEVSDAQKLKEGAPNATMAILEGMNHILKKAEADRLQNIGTYSDPVLPLHDKLIETMVEFIDNLEIK